MTKPWQSCTVEGDYGNLLGLSILFFLLYVIGIPTMFGILLYKNRDSLKTPETRLLLGFFYMNYSPRYYYTEIFWLLRNFALTASFTFFQDNKPVQGNEYP